MENKVIALLHQQAVGLGMKRTAGRQSFSYSFIIFLDFSLDFPFLHAAYSPGLVTYTYTPTELAKTMVKTMAIGGAIAGAFYMFGPAAALVFI